MTTKKNSDELKASVVVDISVSRKAWMELYGQHITDNLLVPEVTLVNLIRKAVQEKIDELNIPSLQIK